MIESYSVGAVMARTFKSVAVLILIWTSGAVNPLGQKPNSPANGAHDRSCHEFVQNFYNWYVAREAEWNRKHDVRTTMDYAIRRRPELFSSDLLKMLREDSQAQAKAHELVGLDFDPFFNSQDPSSSFKVQSVNDKDGHCRAVVYGLEQGTKMEEVEPELEWLGGRWVFVNFHYGKSKSDDDNLVHILNALNADRGRNKN